MAGENWSKYRTVVPEESREDLADALVPVEGDDFYRKAKHNSMLLLQAMIRGDVPSDINEAAHKNLEFMVASEEAATAKRSNKSIFDVISEYDGRTTIQQTVVLESRDNKFVIDDYEGIADAGRLIEGEARVLKG